jgi:response regulator NasT
MIHGYRILLAVAEKTDCDELLCVLNRLGYNVVAIATEARTALRLAFDIQPDAMIVDPAIPDHGGTGIIDLLEEHRLTAVIFYARSEALIAAQAKKNWVFAYLLAPVDEGAVALSVEVAVANFQRLIALEEENRRLKRDLSSRRLIEQAKGLLVEKKGLSEREAYHYLQRLSMDRRQSMTKIAREIIITLRPKV